MASKFYPLWVTKSGALLLEEGQEFSDINGAQEMLESTLRKSDLFWIKTEDGLLTLVNGFDHVVILTEDQAKDLKGVDDAAV